MKSVANVNAIYSIAAVRNIRQALDPSASWSRGTESSASRYVQNIPTQKKVMPPLDLGALKSSQATIAKWVSWADANARRHTDCLGEFGLFD
jgi:hypothetical protein